MKKKLIVGFIVLFILSGIRLFAQDALIKETCRLSSFREMLKRGDLKVVSNGYSIASHIRKM